ncbi:MAG: hypothetical protein R3B70_17660 [Polyangiaceae bacterium]
MSDGATTSRTAGGAGARESFRRGLSPRAERVAYSLVEALLADEDEAGALVPAPAATCERAVVWLTRAAGSSSVNVRGGFGLLTFVVQVLPLFVIGAPSRMTKLSLADRVRFLSALETSRIGLFSMLFLAFKVPLAIAAFEEGDELRSTGYDRPTTASRRQLVWLSEPGLATHEEAGAAEGAQA